MKMSEQILLPSDERDYYEEYFQKIESLFAALRGRGILLSPADYQLARNWYDKGISLSCVLRGIRAAFYKKISEGDDIEEEIISLAWCKWAVNQEWKEYKSISPGEDSPFQRLEPSEAKAEDTALVLESICFDLRQRAGGFEAQEMTELAQAVTAIADSLAAEGDATEIDLLLEKMDSEMLDAVEKAADEEIGQKLLKAVDRKLKPFKAKMSEADYLDSRQSAFREKLRQAYALPKLTITTLQF
jgi:hypothetical protein